MKKNSNKKILNIEIWVNNPILREKSKNVVNINEDIQNFCIDLLDTMREKDWVWLAAPQVWKNIRIVAITQWKTKWQKYELLSEEILINPQIKSKSNEIEIDEEWCLSVPWIKGKVKRHKTISIEYQNINWHTKILRANWFNARIIQHELDHLDGILFVDKLIKKPEINFNKAMNINKSN